MTTETNEYADDWSAWETDLSINEMVPYYAWRKALKGDYSRTDYLRKYFYKVEEAITSHGWEDGCECDLMKAVELAKEKEIAEAVTKDLPFILVYCAENKFYDEFGTMTDQELERIESICDTFDTEKTMDDLYNAILNVRWNSTAVEAEKTPAAI